jgi:hypothetical protein
MPAPLGNDVDDLAPASQDSVMSDVFGANAPQLDVDPCPTPIAAPGTPPRQVFDQTYLDAEVFMPGSLTVPGLQHIASNMCNETHTSLARWPKFWDQLKVLEALLSLHERRSRLIWTCIRGGPFESKDPGA